jgi:hypothetical protein
MSLKEAVVRSLLGTDTGEDVRISSEDPILQYFTEEFYSGSTSTDFPYFVNTSDSPQYSFDNLQNFFEADNPQKPLPKSIDELDAAWSSFCLSTDSSTAGNVNGVIGQFTFSSQTPRNTAVRDALAYVLVTLNGEELRKAATEGSLRNALDTRLTYSNSGATTLTTVEWEKCEQAARPYLVYRYLEVIPINGKDPLDADHPEPSMHKVLRNLAKIIMVCKSIMKAGNLVIVEESKAKIIQQMVLIPFGLEKSETPGNVLEKYMPTATVTDKSKMLEDYISTDLYMLIKQNVDDSNSLVQQRLELQEDTEKMGIIQRNLKSLASNEERIRVRLQFMKAFLVGASVFAAVVAAALAFGIVNGNGFVVFVVAVLVICLALAYEVYDGILATVKVLD